MDPATAIPESPRRYEPPTREMYLKQVELDAIERHEAEWERAQRKHAAMTQHVASEVEYAGADYDKVFAQCMENLREFFTNVDWAEVNFDPRYIKAERQIIKCNAAVERIVYLLRQKGYRVDFDPNSDLWMLHVCRYV